MKLLKAPDPDSPEFVLHWVEVAPQCTYWWSEDGVEKSETHVGEPERVLMTFFLRKDSD